jgi:DNA-binding CsgD family transcriptional regulator
MSSVGDTEISTEMPGSVPEDDGAAVDLLERDGELERLGTLLSAAADGSGGALLVRADAGIGKTRLLGALRERAGASKLTPLGARGGVLEQDFPFGCVRQLFEQKLADPGDRSRLLEGDAAMSAPVFGPPGGEQGPRPDGGYGVLHGLYWLTANLAEPGPLLLTVDDAHWADPPSLRYLSFLARRLEGVPVALVVAMRPADPAAPPELGELAREIEVLDLAPLSGLAAAELVRAEAGAEVSESVCLLCHEATGGNPFLLGELLREASGAPLSAERIETLGPDRVAEVVFARIEAMGTGAVDLASAVALLGDGVELRAAARLAGLADDAGEVADGLASIGVLEAGRPLSFVHPIVRNAVYGRIPPAQRHRGHLEAAAQLKEGGASPEAVAAHLLATEPGERFEPVEVLMAAAGDAGSRGAPDLALRYLERALAEPPPPEQRPRVLTELGRTAAVLGDPRALDWLREAVDAGGSSPAGVAAAIALGRALTFAGRTDEALTVGQRALSGGGGDQPGTRLERWLISLAQLTPSTRQPAIELVRGNLEAARDGKDLPGGLLASAAIEASLTEGERDLSLELAERAIVRWQSEAERPENLEPGLAIAAFVIGERFQRAETILEQILAGARRLGSLRLYAGSYSFRAWVRQRQGKLAEVRADADLYPDFPQAAVTDLMLAGAHLQALVDAGELDRAAALVGPVEAMRLDDQLAIYQRFAEGLAALRLAQGDPRAALEVTDRMARWERESGQGAGTWVAWRSQAALAHAGLGEAERALELAGEQVELATAFGAPGMLGSALRIQGRLTGDEEGIELLQRAASSLEGSGMRLEHARALVDLGAARRRAGRPAEAREDLRSGLDAARRCEATALAEQALEELIAAGGRPRRASASEVDGLTPSERRVAEMAASGMSNKEIAQALFVTVRTVETHLFNSYRKLEIKSRSQLKTALSG